MYVNNIMMMPNLHFNHANLEEVEILQVFNILCFSMFIYRRSKTVTKGMNALSFEKGKSSDSI